MILNETLSGLQVRNLDLFTHALLVVTAGCDKARIATLRTNEPTACKYDSCNGGGRNKNNHQSKFTTDCRRTHQNVSRN
jgi:hypothetical protein